MFNGKATEYIEHIFKIKAYVGNTGFRRERGEILRVAPTEANDMDELHPNQNKRRSSIAETSQVRMSRDLDTSTTTQVAKLMVKH